MFWLGDSAMGWKYNLRKLPAEFRQGISDGIPLCCVIVYVVCILVSLVTRKDSRIFEFVYREYEDFLRTDYWRCPLCKKRKRVIKVRWTSEPNPPITNN